MLESVLLSSVSCLFFFFFKQKTAYEMRISDWSSDVCSSDLRPITDYQRAYASYAAIELAKTLNQLDSPLPSTPSPDGHLDRDRLLDGVCKIRRMNFHMQSTYTILLIKR